MMAVLKRLIPLFNRHKRLSHIGGDDVPTTDGSESLYPRRVPATRDDSSQRRRREDPTRNRVPMHIQGRQLGVSFRGEKIHVLREVSYSSNRFLCGAKKHPDEPLFVGTAYTDALELCGTCARLAEKGVV